MSSFEEFFTRATGNPPYGYQSRLARDGLPSVVQAPTGSGKTGIILAWLWRRLFGPDPEATPRRLIFALPQRTLVEQVSGEVRKWLDALGLTEQVALHVVMGGEGKTQPRWRLNMHQPAIVVGTVDSLVSKALNRGYGIPRAIYPIDFALVTNGAHWVIDEIQLCPESATTLRQIAGFVRRFGTAEPFGLTCMSATVNKKLLLRVDNPDLGEVVSIEPADRTGELATRLDATRILRRLSAEPGDYKAIAAAVRERHRPGTLTLVVMNTVAAAQAVRAALVSTDVPITLLHSRFRGIERAERVKEITAEPGPAGRIVVSTQVVEAGVDINAAVLVTEAAPWPSVVQRAGRCNRNGRIADAELWWLPPARPEPYSATDIDAAVAELTALEGIPVTGEALLAREVVVTEPDIAVIRRGDLLTLFDTAPDLTGSDIDISPYVRDADDLDVQLAWATWDPGFDGQPPEGVRAPEQQYRCRVPLRDLAQLIKRGVAVWRFDQALRRWTRVTSRQPARPGEVLVVAAKDGGYDPESGFDAAVKGPVPGCPELMPARDPATGAEDGFHDDDASVGQQDWLPLQQHSDDVREQAKALLAVIRPVVPDGVADAVITAGYAHDAGKVHKTWQDALCSLASEEERERVNAGRPWAKSGKDGRLTYASGGFRHELVSMMLLDGPLRGLLDGVTDADLVRYLVLAHHGKLRVQVRGPDDSDEKTLLGLTDGELMEIPPLLGQPAAQLAVDLEQFSLGHERSWTRTALGLRDRYGPFVLAYLETLVRIADWRASAGEEIPR